MTLTKEQVRNLLVPPVAYIDPGKSEIDIRRRNFLYCTKGCDSTVYNGTYIVDSQGNSFLIKSVNQLGGVLFWTSILVFSPIVEVLPEVDEVKRISVDEFKELVFRTISKKPHAWASLDTVPNIKHSIDRCSTYLDVMKVFHLGLK
jgi:hypothetical protein